MRRTFVGMMLTATALLTSSASNAEAGMIIVSNLDTDDIVIPVFNTALGTLTAVDLSVTMRAGTTLPGGGHAHGTTSLVSSNVRSDTNVGGFLPFTVQSSSAGGFSHSILTPGYSGGGINLGSFSSATTPESSHVHSVQITYSGTVPFGEGYRAVAMANTIGVGNHAQAYFSDSKLLNFTGGTLTPFLGPSNIIIVAGQLNTQTAGNHNHSLSGFNVTVSSQTGPWTWNFSGTSLGSVGTHLHQFDPRFDTVATFYFDEPQGSTVPEPTSMALAGFAGLGMAAGAWRRRRQQRQQAA